MFKCIDINISYIYMLKKHKHINIDTQKKHTTFACCSNWISILPSDTSHAIWKGHQITSFHLTNMKNRLKLTPSIYIYIDEVGT